MQRYINTKACILIHIQFIIVTLHTVITLIFHLIAIFMEDLIFLEDIMVGIFLMVIMEGFIGNP